MEKDINSGFYDFDCENMPSHSVFFDRHLTAQELYKELKSFRESLISQSEYKNWGVIFLDLKNGAKMRVLPGSDPLGVKNFDTFDSTEVKFISDLFEDNYFTIGLIDSENQPSFLSDDFWYVSSTGTYYNTEDFPTKEDAEKEAKEELTGEGLFIRFRIR